MASRMNTRVVVAFGVVVLIFAVLLAHATAQSRDNQSGDDYIIGPVDVLAVDVWTHDDLTSHYPVASDGTLRFPLIERIRVAGLTLREVEMELTRLLADGFIRNPEVTVSIAEYHSRVIFVMGAVQAPGAYPLRGETSLLEAIAGAGRTDAASSDVVLIVRANGKEGPVLPGEKGSAEVFEVDLRAIQEGALSGNIMLRAGDTIFVPPAEMVYVFGRVSRPGAYPIRRGMTVLQALALAGGATELAAVNRIKIVRTLDGAQRELKGNLGDLVQPGDTIMVPQRFL